MVGAGQEGEGGEIEERFLSAQAGAFAGANAKEKAPARFARNDSVGCCDLVGQNTAIVLSVKAARERSTPHRSCRRQSVRSKLAVRERNVRSNRHF